MINLLPTLDSLWAAYVSDDEALDARVPFPDWVRQQIKKQDDERREREAQRGSTGR